MVNLDPTSPTKSPQKKELPKLEPVQLPDTISDVLHRLAENEMLEVLNWGAISYEFFTDACQAALSKQDVDIELNADLAQVWARVADARKAVSDYMKLVGATYLVPKDSRWAEVRWAMDEHGMVHVATPAGDLMTH